MELCSSCVFNSLRRKLAIDMEFNKNADQALQPEDVDLAANAKDGRVWILHSPRLVSQDSLGHVLYDTKKHMLTLVDQDGKTAQDINVVLQRNLRKTFKKTDVITVIWTDRGEIFGMNEVPLKKQDKKQ